jgi:hypothetical protein
MKRYKKESLLFSKRIVNVKRCDARARL